MLRCPEPEEGKKLKVTMVAWDCSDKYVITAANDFTVCTLQCGGKVIQNTMLRYF